MISIFIRTYHCDIKWLNYCLESIHKNLSGWSEIVICIPTGQETLLSHLTSEKVVTCKIYKDDYLGQQISKIQAVILTIVSIIIYIYTKGQLEVYQILVVLYILKLMENIVHIILLLIKQAIDNNK